MTGAAPRARAMLLAMMAAIAPLMACGQPDAAMARQASMLGADPKKAPAILRSYGCTSCHMVPGIRGADAWVGPPLTAFAERRFIAGRVPNEPDYLVQFIVNPQAIKPGSAMPVTGISAEEARDVAAYLYTRR
jgi:cytochrome c2